VDLALLSAVAATGLSRLQELSQEEGSFGLNVYWEKKSFALELII
jgi:hypothetical protein